MFTVSLIDEDSYYEGKHKDKKGFKGFYIQARETRRNHPIGQFTPTQDQSVKVHNCADGEQVRLPILIFESKEHD